MSGARLLSKENEWNRVKVWKLCKVFFLGCHSTSQNVYLFKVLWSKIWLRFYVQCRNQVLQCYCPMDQQMINLFSIEILTLFLTATVQMRKNLCSQRITGERVFVKHNWILLFFWPNYRFVRNSICWLQTISFRHQLNVAFGVDFLEPCAI